MHDYEKSIHYGWEFNAFTLNEHVIISENFVLFLTLIIFLCFLNYQTKFNVQNIFLQYMAKLPHSAWVVLISMFIGGMIRWAAETNPSHSHQDDGHGSSSNPYHPIFLNFNTNIFYFGFLPIIIFTSGFHVKRMYFYQNLDIIMSLAVVGTLIATSMTAFGLYVFTNQTFQASLGIESLSKYLATSVAGGEEILNFNVLECIAFASLISSTDPVSTLAIYQHLQVDYQLYYLVFGESILNDAVAITIYKTSANYIAAGSMSNIDSAFMIINFIVIFIGSCCLGYFLGILMAWLFKIFPLMPTVEDGNKSTDPYHTIIPLAIILCMIYIPYFFCEMLQLSGIVANFFAGMAVRRYVMKNVSKAVKQMASQVFEVFAYLAETCCFIILGLSLFLLDDINFSPKYLTFIALVFGLILIARAVHVYGLLSLINIIRSYRNAKQVRIQQQFQFEMQAIGSESAPHPNSLAGEDSNKEMMTAQLQDLYQKDKAPGKDIESNNNPMITSPDRPKEGEIQNNILPIENEIKQIPMNYMHMTFIAGLRGAVAYALAYSFPDVHGNRNNVLGATAVIVVLTLFFFGGLTQPLIQYFQIPRKTATEYRNAHIQPSISFSAFSQEDNNVLVSPPKVQEYACVKKSTNQDFERKYLYPLVILPSQQPYAPVQLSSPNQSQPHGGEEQKADEDRSGQKPRSFLWSFPSATTRKRASSMGNVPEPSSGGGSVHHGGHEVDAEDIPVLTYPRHSNRSIPSSSSNNNDHN